MRKLIKVTKDDIDAIKQDYNHNSCPIALAIGRQLSVCDVEVTLDYFDSMQTRIVLDGVRCNGPRSTARFVKKIDGIRGRIGVTFAKSIMKPFNFYLDIPEE